MTQKLTVTVTTVIWMKSLRETKPMYTDVTFLYEYGYTVFASDCSCEIAHNCIKRKFTKEITALKWLANVFM
jgi:hypothetical protein